VVKSSLQDPVGNVVKGNRVSVIIIIKRENLYERNLRFLVPRKYSTMRTLDSLSSLFRARLFQQGKRKKERNFVTERERGREKKKTSELEGSQNGQLGD